MARHLPARQAVFAGMGPLMLAGSAMGRDWLSPARRWTLRTGLFILPLAYLPTTYDRWVLPKLLVARILVLALAALFMADALRRRELVVKRTPLDLPLVAFVGSAALSTAFAFNVNVAIFGMYGRYDGLLTIATYALLFWLAVQALDGPDEAWTLLYTFVASAYVAAVIAIVQSILNSVSQVSLFLVGTDAMQGGVVRAYGSLGQWEVLGEVLVVAWPVALWQMAVAGSARSRLLALNAVVVIGLALVLTFSRSAWAATALASMVLVAGLRPWSSPRRLSMVLAAGAAVLVLAGGLAVARGWTFENALVQRASTVVHPGQWDVRMTIWRDSIRLIESRPLLGYGPDTFGLVFPGFNTVDYGLAVDKAHSELLQVAATQGVVGVAAYLWLLIAAVLTLWRGRRRRGVFALLAGFLAYQAMLQVNFSAIGSAMPFWMFAASSMTASGAISLRKLGAIDVRARTALRIGAASLAPLGIAAAVLPYLADASLFQAVWADGSGDGVGATTAAANASTLAPAESVYRVEDGNIAFERADWTKARAAYSAAAALGTYNPVAYRNLAIADRHLGLTAEARNAAQTAYDLNRFDPASQALLAQFGVRA